MYKWYLPTLSEIIQSDESDVIQATRRKHPSEHAEQQWYGAIAALNTLLTRPQSVTSPHEILEAPSASGLEPNLETNPEAPKSTNDDIKGVILSGPFPVLNRMTLGERFATWMLTGDPSLRMGALQLPSADGMTSSKRSRGAATTPTPATEPTLLLHPDDPLAVEPFCLVLTPGFSVMVTLGLDDHHSPQFFFSVDPDTIWQGWRSLRSRLQLTAPTILPSIECRVEQFSPQAPDYRMVMEFSQLMMMQTPQGSERRGRRYRSHHHSQTLHSQTPQASTTAPKAPSSLADVTVSKDVSPLPFTRGEHTSNQEQANHEEHARRYPAKPLNVNRTERLKLDGLSWKNVIAPGQQTSQSLKGTEARGAKSQGTASRGTANHRTDIGTTKGMRSPTSEPQGTRAQASSTRSSHQAKNEMPQAQIGSDVELLKAIAHEVRTPLTTIRTLTRLLMKRKDLVDVVVKRLEQIDQECTKQIDRFSLIFKAVEVETASVNHAPNHLARISLLNMFQQNVARWKQQAQQRNLTLEVALPPTLPSVMSDPTVLDQVLTGLMDRMTHTLPPGTLIQLSVVPVGHQLKLQFWAKPQDEDARQSSTSPASIPFNPSSDQHGKKAATPGEFRHSIFAPTLQSVGQVLMFQPETGNLSLNLDVTKNLFQSLGGKFIVRHTPTKGEVLTIFLPMDDTESNGLSPSIKGKFFC